MIYRPAGALTILLTTPTALSSESERWAEDKPRASYAQQPWLVGANYIPATAINELALWQADSFSPKRKDIEFACVFLHDLLCRQDAPGFRKRIDQALAIGNRHGIRPILVLFDSCWVPFPRVGPQKTFTPGVHNSGWLQSPGAEALPDPSQHKGLEACVRRVVKAFSKDKQILAWDIWNQPENPNTSRYASRDASNKADLVLGFFPNAVVWARSANASQPPTAAIWHGDFSSHGGVSFINRMTIESSDVVSFHNCAKPEKFEIRVGILKRYNRPVLRTESMARGAGSKFEGVMPTAKANGVAPLNCGLVQGKRQTSLRWDTWAKPYRDSEPPVWFHEVVKNEGTPCRGQEAEPVRKMTDRHSKIKAAKRAA